MSVEFKLTGGKIREVTMHRPTHFSLNDCRRAPGGFVSVNFSDGDHEIQVFVPTVMVSDLLNKLSGLSVLDPQYQKEQR